MMLLSVLCTHQTEAEGERASSLEVSLLLWLQLSELVGFTPLAAPVEHAGDDDLQHDADRVDVGDREGLAGDTRREPPVPPTLRDDAESEQRLGRRHAEVGGQRQRQRRGHPAPDRDAGPEHRGVARAPGLRGGHDDGEVADHGGDADDERVDDGARGRERERPDVGGETQQVGGAESQQQQREHRGVGGEHEEGVEEVRGDDGRVRARHGRARRERGHGDPPPPRRRRLRRVVVPEAEHGGDAGLGQQQEGERERQRGREREDGLRQLGLEQREEGGGREPRGREHGAEPRRHSAQRPRRRRHRLRRQHRRRERQRQQRRHGGEAVVPGEERGHGSPHDPRRRRPPRCRHTGARQPRRSPHVARNATRKPVTSPLLVPHLSERASERRRRRSNQHSTTAAMQQCARGSRSPPLWRDRLAGCAPADGWMDGWPVKSRRELEWTSG
jgi:hypothetical protein